MLNKLGVLNALKCHNQDRNLKFFFVYGRKNIKCTQFFFLSILELLGEKKKVNENLNKRFLKSM